MPTQTQSHRIDPTAITEDEIATLTNATVTLPIDKIRRDGGTQIRLQIDPAKVAEYAEMIGAGIITVHGLVFYDGSDYWLGDGFHRCAGLIELKRTHAHVEVRAGTRRDAVLYAATQANNKHGLPLTKEDRRNAALTLLRDADWSAWTDREIARRVGLTHPTVAKLRVQVEDERRNSAAQKRAGNETPGKRKVIRGGTVYEMDVENIGSTPNTLASNQQAPLSQSDGRGAGGEGLPTTRQLVATWLDQRSSSQAARRVLLNQLINNDATGKLLWRGLLQFLPNVDDKEDVLPHLRAELARLEETAIVDGETYQQVTIEDNEHNWKNLPDTHSTPTPLTVNEAAAVIAKDLNRKAKDPARQRQLLNASDISTYTEQILPTRTLNAEVFQAAAAQIRTELDRRIAAGQPKPGTKTHTSPKQPMTQRSNPVTDLAASYEKHVIAWAKAQCAAGNYTTLKDAASAALKPDSEAFASMCAYMAEHVDAQKDWTQNGALIIAIGDVAWRLVKEDNPPAHTANDDDDAAPATIATNDDDATAAPNQQSSPRRFLRGELEGGFLSDTNIAASNQQTPLYQSDGRGAGGEGLSAAATLRKAVDDARRQIDRLACTVAGQTLGQPFERLHTDIVQKLRSLQTLLNDQYPEDNQ
jgi:hypothetical protein